MIEIENRFKVRFFHPQTQQMFYPDENLKYVNNAYHLGEMFDDVKKGKLIPMQYTGLTDKRCTLLFEGDIVELGTETLSRYRVGIKGIIEYDNNENCLIFKGLTTKKKYKMHQIQHNDFRILGNIYENNDIYEQLILKSKQYKRVIDFNSKIIIKNGRITSPEVEKLIEKDLKLMDKQTKVRKFKMENK